MIKWGGRTEHGGLIGIGLSRENCKRLLEGKPIVYRLDADHQPDDDGELTVFIVGGETEDAMVKDLETALATHKRNRERS